MKSNIKKLSILLLAVVVLMSTTTINLASSVPAPTGNDLTSSVNVRTDLFSYFDHKADEEVIVIKDNVIVTDNITMYNKENFQLDYSWSIDDAVEPIREGDFFRIPLPEHINALVFVGENGFLPIYNGTDNTLIGHWRVTSENVGEKTINYIEFVAHSNFAAVIADREGFFSVDGYVLHTTSSEIKTTLTFPDIDVDATIKNPDYEPPRHEQEGYGAAEAKPSQMPHIAKNAAGVIAPSPTGDGTGAGLWTVRYGYDDYVNTSHLRAGDTYETKQNVVIRDEIEQDGHVFVDMTIRVPYFQPHNEDGVTSAYWKASWAPSMADLGIQRYYESDYASTAEWEAAISAPANAPAYGISDNGKIAIINIGDILESGIPYSPDNETLETMLRKPKTLTNEEVKTIMQSIGKNTPSYTLTEYDGTKETIAIESFLDNRAICFMVNFHSRMDIVSGREYSNELTLSYDGHSEEVQSVNRFSIQHSEGGAVGTPTGILYLYKFNEENYGTAGEEEITGAQFDLYKINGSSEEFISSKYTDNVGSVLFENMEVGKYRLYEKSSPDNFITNSLKLYKRQADGTYLPYAGDSLGDNWFEFEVTEDDRYFYFEGTNRKSNGTPVSITKTDSVDPTMKLIGATFQLSNGTDSYTSVYNNVTELYEFPLMPLGKYTLEETVVPSGYEKDTLGGVADIDHAMDGIQIIISDETPIVLTLTNELTSTDPAEPTEEDIDKPLDPDKPVDPSDPDGQGGGSEEAAEKAPYTGDNSLILVYVGGIFIALIGLIVIGYRKYKKTK